MKRIFFLILIISVTFVAPAFSAEKESITLQDVTLALRHPYLLNQENVASNASLLMFNSEFEKSPLMKSKGKAFLLSFLMPGAGEYYIGNKTLAKSFFFTELVLWAGYFSFKSYSDWKRDDMYLFASAHAGANARNKPPQYFVDIGNYDNIYEYNDAKQRQREFFNVYPEDEYYWNWDAVENREEFEQMRISSDRAHNRSIFAIGGIIANHLLSAIDAVWQSYKYNKKLSQGNINGEENFRVQFGGMNHAGNVIVSIETRF